MRSRLFIASAVSLLISSCGSSGHSSLLPSDSVPAAGASTIISPATLATPTAAVQQSVPITFRFAMPSASLTTEAMKRHRQDAAYGSGYTSNAFTPSISLTVTPVGGSPAGPYTSTCTSGTSGYCNVSFTAAPGPTVFAGTLSENGNVVARFSQTQIVQPSVTNTISFTASPVVASVVLQLASTTINAGTPQSVVLTVLANDANGNTIAGSSPYVDANGNPVVITLATAQSRNGGGGSATIQGPGRITAPGQAAIALQYDGRWLDHTDVSASTSSSAIDMSAASTTLTTRPYAIEYPATNGPLGMTAGPDGNIWYAGYNTNTIVKVSPSGVPTSYACGCTAPSYIIPGPDGNLWFTASGSGQIKKMTTSGISSLVVSGLNAPTTLRFGPDGNLWYSQANGGSSIGRIAVDGSRNTEWSPSAGARGIGFSSNGTLWFANVSLTTIGRLSLQGTPLGTTTIPNLGLASDGVVLGSDGNMWIVNFGSHLLHKITPNGALTTISLQSGASPRDIANGPDGNLWFTEPGKNTIGTIAPNSSTPTEFTTANGIDPASAPASITLGPDGNIWFMERGTAKIAKFVW